MDRPKLNITEISYPSIVNFDDTFTINFHVIKSLGSNPKNVVIEVQSPIFVHEWTFPELTEERSFNIDSNGKSLKPDSNPYNITVTYEDDEGKKYVESADIVIQSDATFIQKIALWFNVVGHWIEDL